jgi:hypothetical protein
MNTPLSSLSVNTTEMLPRRKLVIKRKKPVVATPDFTAPDDKPSSLPPATLNAIAEALGRGEYLQDVDCYWSPKEADELIALSKGFSCSLTDYRKRHYALTVAHLPTKEARVKTLESSAPALKEALQVASKALYDAEADARKRGVKYFELKSDPEVVKAELARKKAENALTYNQLDIASLKNEIRATKEWKPIRRIVVSFTSNDHTTDKTIADINKNKEAYPSLAPKLVQVINFRKEAMNEMNKRRDNPMRNIYINIVLTPMDFKADCSWTIHRSSSQNDWTYWTHYLHTTEYNLAGVEAVEFKSREQLMTDAEKAEEEAKKKRLAELKKVPYEDYFLISKYDIGRAISKSWDYNIDAVVNDDDWYESTRFNPETKACDEKYQTHNISQLVATKVNHTDNTFTIIGYMYERSFTDISKEKIEPHIKKAKAVMTITYPTPSKRCKTTQLQKDLKKLTQNYEIPE